MRIEPPWEAGFPEEGSGCANLRPQRPPAGFGPNPGEPLAGRRGGMIIAGAGPGGRPAGRWGRRAEGGGRKAGRGYSSPGVDGPGYCDGKGPKSPPGQNARPIIGSAPVFKPFSSLNKITGFRIVGHPRKSRRCVQKDGQVAHDLGELGLKQYNEKYMLQKLAQAKIPSGLHN